MDEIKVIYSLESEMIKSINEVKAQVKKLQISNGKKALYELFLNELFEIIRSKTISENMSSLISIVIDTLKKDLIEFYKLIANDSFQSQASIRSNYIDLVDILGKLFNGYMLNGFTLILANSFFNKDSFIREYEYITNTCQYHNHIFKQLLKINQAGQNQFKSYSENILFNITTNKITEEGVKYVIENYKEMYALCLSLPEYEGQVGFPVFLYLHDTKRSALVDYLALLSKTIESHFMDKGNKENIINFLSQSKLLGSEVHLANIQKFANECNNLQLNIEYKIFQLYFTDKDKDKVKQVMVELAGFIKLYPINGYIESYIRQKQSKDLFDFLVFCVNKIIISATELFNIFLNQKVTIDHEMSLLGELLNQSLDLLNRYQCSNSFKLLVSLESFNRLNKEIDQEEALILTKSEFPVPRRKRSIALEKKPFFEQFITYQKFSNSCEP
ncbi:MAG: hypothetical protein EP298_10245 [Gammaproteobacteria bacterium]|nr:MAG: hypothetical protein EP298_10245 [Gammaproteobacteria bacterium]UTW42155.1 hypothetical protein KFE69_11765 [bacterium SCSIO 12844]